VADQGTLTVHDEASLNGTWVNDRRIAGTAALRRGDRLRIGGSEFVVADGEDPDEALGIDREEKKPWMAAEAAVAGIAGGGFESILHDGDDW
jgi:pSer/pThr/pTyr-binding forkhead associated (FHA) protein